MPEFDSIIPAKFFRHGEGVIPAFIILLTDTDVRFLRHHSHCLRDIEIPQHIEEVGSRAVGFRKSMNFDRIDLRFEQRPRGAIRHSFVTVPGTGHGGRGHDD